jgi:hypothetical protein
MTPSVVVVRIRVVTVQSNSKLSLLVALAALLGVFSVLAPWLSVTARAGARREDPVLRRSTHQLLEPGQSSCLNAPPNSSDSGSAEFAELNEEESNDDDEGQDQGASSGDVCLLFGSTHPLDTPARGTPPIFPRASLFLLCGHMVC